MCYKISRLKPNKVINLLRNFRKKYSFKFYNELSDNELKNITQLKISDIRLSKNRQFSNPIFWMDTSKKKETFKKEFCLLNTGFLISDGGRFLHVSDQYDKALAMKKFIGITSVFLGKKYLVVSLGDSQNDVGMLEYSDYSCIVKRRNSKISLKKKKNIYFSNNTAPDGWSESIDFILRLENKNF